MQNATRPVDSSDGRRQGEDSQSTCRKRYPRKAAGRLSVLLRDRRRVHPPTMAGGRAIARPATSNNQHDSLEAVQDPKLTGDAPEARVHAKQ
jgi:hypothetical protein